VGADSAECLVTTHGWQCVGSTNQTRKRTFFLFRYTEAATRTHRARNDTRSSNQAVFGHLKTRDDTVLNVAGCCPNHCPSLREASEHRARTCDTWSVSGTRPWRTRSTGRRRTTVHKGGRATPCRPPAAGTPQRRFVSVQSNPGRGRDSRLHLYRRGTQRVESGERGAGKRESRVCRDPSHATAACAVRERGSA
jgi:hypothetical protein